MSGSGFAFHVTTGTLLDGSIAALTPAGAAGGLFSLTVTEPLNTPLKARFRTPPSLALARSCTSRSSSPGLGVPRV